MTNIKIEIPVGMLNQETAINMQKSFSNISIPWIFCQKETIFSSKVILKKKQHDRYKYKLAGIKKMIDMFPNDEALKEELKIYEEKHKNDWTYTVIIRFEGDIAANIDIEDNSILHYTGPIDENAANRGATFLKKFIKYDFLDEFYEEEFKRFIVCIVMSCILADPSVNIGCGTVRTIIDDEEYRTDMLIESPLHEYAFEKHKDFMNSSLTFEQTFMWLKEQADFNETSKKPMVAFTTLTYVLNREEHESLLYSVIGLESIYTPKSKGISVALQKRINHIFPSITKEQIKDIYKKRSDFVHGETRINTYKDISDVINGKAHFDDTPILAIALLIESLRLLISNNAKTISFDEKISHKFK